MQAVTVRDAAGQPLLTLRYGWDATGRLAATEVDGKRFEYAYDAASRLAAARLPDGSRREYAFDRGASLVQAGAARFELDPAGRPTRLREAGTEATLAWAPGSPSGTSTRSADGSAAKIWCGCTPRITSTGFSPAAWSPRSSAPSS